MIHRTQTNSTPTPHSDAYEVKAIAVASKRVNRWLT